MEFQTMVIPIGEQIQCVDRTIGDYKEVLERTTDDRVFQFVQQDLFRMVAVRESLNRLVATGLDTTSIDHEMIVRHS